MRILASLLAIYCTLNVTAQRTYSDQETKRLADLGRLWGMLHYFHPKMGTGEIVTDSLILTPAASLIADPSAENFKRCIASMLARLNDPSTNLRSEKASLPTILFTTAPKNSAIHKLPDGTSYIAFPTEALQAGGDPFMIPGLRKSDWDSAKAIILDIRNDTGNHANADALFLFRVLPKLISSVLGDPKLPGVYERIIYHTLYPGQSGSPTTGFNNGWQISSTDRINIAGGGGKFNKPVAIAFNSNTDVRLIRVLYSLKVAGVCKLIYEGSMTDYPTGRLIPVEFYDSVMVNFRVSDYLVGKNSSLLLPDLQTDCITENSFTGEFIKQCLQLIKSKPLGEETNKVLKLYSEYIYPSPGIYSNNELPEKEKRLFALYNWWNTIHYFFPYKKLIGRDWDSVLYEYIPRMLNANDTLLYFHEMVSMITEIKDSHGGFYHVNPGAAPPVFNRAYGYRPSIKAAFVGNKLAVIDIGNDSLPELKEISLWDEITHIDNKPINEIIEANRHFVCSSNDDAFLRDLRNFILLGKENSSLQLRLTSGGKQKEVTLPRIKGKWLSDDRLYFNHADGGFKLLPGNIGYVNVGVLKPEQVDSVMDVFINAKAIIFDIRNYPKVDMNKIAARLTQHEKKAAILEVPFVTYNNIKGGNNVAIKQSSRFVIPDNQKPVYRGKTVILCNAITQSAAEFSIMFLQAATNATVIGSQTAGADGNVTDVALPGGYKAMFSGLAVLYPDGGQTQRVGIRIDIEVKPTIEGLKAGKDEVFLSAIEFINKGK